MKQILLAVLVAALFLTGCKKEKEGKVLSPDEL